MASGVWSVDVGDGVVGAAVAVLVGMDVTVGVEATVGVGVRDAVGVEVDVAVAVGVRVGVGDTCWARLTCNGSVRALAMTRTTSVDSSARRAITRPESASAGWALSRG